jgi:hypothetical protein
MKFSVTDAMALCDRLRDAQQEGRPAQVIMPNEKPLAECSGSYIAGVAKDLRYFISRNQRLTRTVKRYARFMEKCAADRVISERSDDILSWRDRYYETYGS